MIQQDCFKVVGDLDFCICTCGYPNTSIHPQMITLDREAALLRCIIYEGADTPGIPKPLLRGLKWLQYDAYEAATRGFGGCWFIVGKHLLLKAPFMDTPASTWAAGGTMCTLVMYTCHVHLSRTLVMIDCMVSIRRRAVRCLLFSALEKGGVSTPDSNSVQFASKGLVATTYELITQPTCPSSLLKAKPT